MKAVFDFLISNKKSDVELERDPGAAEASSDKINRSGTEDGS